MKSKSIIRISILLLIVIGIFYFLSQTPFSELLYQGIVTVLGIVTLLWILSLIVKDSSIVDIFWGSGFVIMVWFYLFSLGNDFFTVRNMVFASLVSIWGLRLTIYLGYRNIGKPEDYRYQNFRKEGGKNYWWISYFRVFILQGFILFVISSLFVPAMKIEENIFSIFSYIGIAFWAIGLFFEAVGDWQLMIFKKNPDNKGKVMNKGLWKYTRHPNYFGDALLWWGYFMFALDYQAGFFFFFAPLFMTFLLMRVSGVPMLEAKLKTSRPKYAEYIAKTSAFFPRLPKK